MYSRRWATMAALYFVLGSSLGLYAGITQQFHLSSPHAHINLLGWVSMTLIAILYRLFPSMESGKLAAVHFWLYQVSFVLFVSGLALVTIGNEAGASLLPPGGSLMLLSVILTAIVIWTNVSRGSASQSRSHVA